MSRRSHPLDAFIPRLARLVGTYAWVEDGTINTHTVMSLTRALEAEGCPMSHSQVSAMLSGQQSSPSAALVGALSRVFRVDVRYWYSPEVARAVQRQLDRRLVQLQAQVRSRPAGASPRSR